MNKYIIEREIPGAGKWSTEEKVGVAQKSFEVLQELGPKISWVKTFIAEDKVYCEYIAESEELVLEHAKKGGFPADKVSLIKAEIDLTTAAV